MAQNTDNAAPRDSLAYLRPPHQARPIRSETRATLVASIARGRRWLNELMANAKANVESIAKRERCSVRQVNMTISLAFLAPDLVKAAIEGRLPRGIGVTRLRDAPVEWSRQQRCSVSSVDLARGLRQPAGSMATYRP